MVSNKQLELSLLNFTRLLPNWISLLVLMILLFFTKKYDNDTVVLLLYADYMISIHIHQSWRAQEVLCKFFKKKDPLPLIYFMELEVLSSSDGLFLSLDKYTYDLFSRTSLPYNKIEHTSLEPNVWFNPKDSTLLDNVTLYGNL